MAFVRQQALGRAENMTGGKQGHRGVAGQPLGMAERQDVLDPVAGQARPHQAGGAGGAKNLPVGGDVIGMRVRDERTGNRKMRIKPPAGLRQPEAVAMVDLPAHGRGFLGLDAWGGLVGW